MTSVYSSWTFTMYLEMPNETNNVTMYGATAVQVVIQYEGYPELKTYPLNSKQ